MNARCAESGCMRLWSQPCTQSCTTWPKGSHRATFSASTGPLWLIWGQNVEARQSIIERFPDARANYVELSDDTNDVENEFRCIQNACVPHGI